MTFLCKILKELKMFDDVQKRNLYVMFYERING